MEYDMAFAVRTTDKALREQLEEAITRSATASVPFSWNSACRS